MKKNIVIEEVSNKVVKPRRLVNNKIYEWIIYMLGYGLVLIIVSKLFASFYINLEYFGLYAFLGAIIIYILNQTIKPILVCITLPLTFITYGLLYPLSNVIILYITSFILGNNFNISGIFSAFFVAVCISILNIFMEGLVIKPIIRK